jgi:hypothetical protein
MTTNTKQIPTDLLFAGIDSIINDNLRVSNFRTKRASLDLADRNPLTVDGEGLVTSLFQQLNANWNAALNCSPSPSLENFRWHVPKPSVSPRNTSPEVKLERALIRACIGAHRRDWSNQVPLISGVVGPRANKRRAVDLVYQTSDGGFEFES